MLDKLLSPEAHGQLADLDVAGFIQWKCVTPTRFRRALAAVREGEMYVACKGVVQAIHDPEHCHRLRHADSPVLTPKRRAVLLGLAKGQTQQQIAEAEGVSLRTIEDRVAGLKEKFDVPTTFMLGVMAERLGFAP